MKIVAVIPARAGSKGIPNKNIRLINGKPLIWYAINNAKNSKYIDEVIVSSDSKEIEVIAKQMHVTFKNRDEALCGDAVKLDEVIYDAVKDLDYDYVITMQPTSPTLKVTTLDNAIEYIVNNPGLETLMSVINKPHLSWREENGKKVPNYKERLNRQYLPANYLETGAFFISHKSVVTEHSRFGKNVDVFEIGEDEAIDIDTYADLKQVQDLLSPNTVAIYVNGNNTRGIGHIYRALEMADEFNTKVDIYYDINQTDIKVFGDTTHHLIPVNGISELFRILEDTKYDYFINDILTTSIDYMIGLRNMLPDAKIINFEDDGEGNTKADVVFNALYQEDALPHIKTGEKYYISNKLFMFYDPIEVKDEVKKIFISFGGADPQNYSDRLLEIVKKEKYKKYEFVVVLGRAKLNVEQLLEYNKYPNITVLYNVANMPELMSSCDIGVTSRGRTGYELCILGIPTIAMAQNKREEKHGFVNNDNGFTYLGLNPSDHIIESTLDMYISMNKEERKHYQDLLLSHELRQGRTRVMKIIKSL